jgi:WD40 repeat protein
VLLEKTRMPMRVLLRICALFEASATRRRPTGKSGQELVTLKGHEEWGFSVAFSLDGKRLATGNSDGTVKLWDAATEQEVLARGKQ